ncbi:hypothetical protein [Neobacillus vireti]|uniref:Riboflavin biosynthesis protein n=1 Tax=Neobacillus vireti LMG 21834 TaxID=1131730 RepID=A0AB94IMW5_9BACI|nr:hypothetical protein [Neobacillus vireti]ETI68298.1 riboflavin biosynthesis protein [Neobacillus vireti LMG 21834]KLT16384.1 hypothetical protein AA980_17995 [Neobacillus vireti]
MIFVEQKTIINLPDQLFSRYCKETFGLNRGVYNTIDEWFYKNSAESIEVRRKKILDFLLFYVSSLKNVEECKIKFGKGNLINLLAEYMNTAV